MSVSKDCFILCPCGLNMSTGKMDKSYSLREAAQPAARVAPRLIGPHESPGDGPWGIPLPQSLSQPNHQENIGDSSQGKRFLSSSPFVILNLGCTIHSLIVSKYPQRGRQRLIHLFIPVLRHHLRVVKALPKPLSRVRELSQLINCHIHVSNEIHLSSPREFCLFVWWFQFKVRWEWQHICNPSI